MQEIKVSICIPIYEVERFIERCARSLFTQSYQNIEYIFVNDCTPDHSIDVLQEVLKEYPNRAKFVNIVSHNINRGLAAARQTAIRHATGDYMFHLDSDDYLEHDAIRLYAGGMKNELNTRTMDDNSPTLTEFYFQKQEMVVW